MGAPTEEPGAAGALEAVGGAVVEAVGGAVEALSGAGAAAGGVEAAGGAAGAAGASGGRARKRAAGQNTQELCPAKPRSDEVRRPSARLAERPRASTGFDEAPRARNRLGQG